MWQSIRVWRSGCLAALLVPCLASAAFSQPVVPAASAPAAALTGKKISLDLKGVDIVDVLKLLSQKSGINFVAGRNVTGRVTIFAKDVDVWEAFERIIEANDFAYERQGELVNVMAARDYELLYGEKFHERKESAVISLRYAKAAQLSTALNQLKSSLGRVVVDEASNVVILNDVPTRLEEMRQVITQLDRPTETRIYSLNYAELDKLKDKVQEFLTPGVGTFNVDVRTNKVVVTDLEENLQTIDRVIRAFDERTREVLIEAKIAKVELSDDQSFGIDWQKTLGGIDAQARGNFRLLGSIVDASSPVTGVALRFLQGSGDAKVILEALQKIGKVNTVSSPRIAVSDGEEAKILVGKKEAFVTVTTTVPTTGSVVNSPQIQFVDVGTKLFVTPKIKRDGQIQLKIRPEVSTADIQVFEGNRIPIVSTTEAETNVIVKSGTTLIIGGLMETNNQRTDSQVPFLGKIPILGMAFRSRSDLKKKTELVVFLTPNIISSSGEQITNFPTGLGMESIQKPEPPMVEKTGTVPLDYALILRDLVATQISRQFRARALAAGSVKIALLVAGDGRIVGRPQVHSLQGAAHVQAAEAALAQLRLPPFPAQTPEQAVQFRLTVDYRP